MFPRQGYKITAEGEPEGLPEATNSTGVFAAKKTDQSETESTVETKEQRLVRREQVCENVERQNTEDKLRVQARETRASQSGEQREAI